MSLSPTAPSRRTNCLPRLEERRTFWAACLVADGGILWCATEKNTKAEIDRAGRCPQVKEVSRMNLLFENSVPGQRLRAPAALRRA